MPRWVVGVMHFEIVGTLAHPRQQRTFEHGSWLTLACNTWFANCFGYIFCAEFFAKFFRIFLDTGTWVLYTPSTYSAPQFGFSAPQFNKESLFSGGSKTTAMPC